MSQFISGQCIKDAVDRLAVCRANSTLLDYLIFRRALQLKKQGAEDGLDNIELSMSTDESEAYQLAAERLRALVVECERKTKCGGE